MADALGIQQGRGEPYEGDNAPEDEMAAMFADEDPSDQLDVAPEPVDLNEPEPDEDEELPRTQPEPDDEPPAEPPADQPPADQEPLVTEGTTEEELAAEVDAESRRYADRFEKVEDLERSYKEVQGAFTRIAQDSQRRDEEAEELRELLEQQQAETASLIQLMTSRMAEEDPEFAERLRRQQEVQAIVDARLAPLQPDEEEEEAYAEQEREQWQDQQVRQAATASITQFFTTHPEIKPGTPEDRKLSETMAVLQQAGVPLALVNPKHIEIAYEASKDDQLAAELMMTPGAVNVPDGIERLKARIGATIPATGQAPPNGAVGTQPQAPQRGPVRKRLEGYVETGSGGAPVDTAPGSQGDEYDKAMDWYQRSYGAKGPLFGSKR